MRNSVCNSVVSRMCENCHPLILLKLFLFHGFTVLKKQREQTSLSKRIRKSFIDMKVRKM